MEELRSRSKAFRAPRGLASSKLLLPGSSAFAFLLASLGGPLGFAGFCQRNLHLTGQKVWSFQCVAH